jgi:putative restriction endonuclease
MKPTQSRWSRQELILALNLYHKVPFGKTHKGNPEIIRLAELIGRTPSAVGLKLGNFASFDPDLQARNIRGLQNTSKLDKEIWDEFYGDWNKLPLLSETLLAKKQNKSVEELHDIDTENLPKGETRDRVVKARVNQSFFRSYILAAYNGACCITGLAQRELLVAGHIRPWSLDEQNRLNPRNGIAINALHDKAFENGFITITPDHHVKVSATLLDQKKSESIDTYFRPCHNKPINLPTKFSPDPDFLRYHNEERFRG